MMNEEEEHELRSRLVVSRNRQGKCRYDPQAKQELILACLKPGISTARMALKFGLNANQLRAWIGQYLQRDGNEQVGKAQRRQSEDVAGRAALVEDVEPAAMFIPVVTSECERMPTMAASALASPPAPSLGLQVRLANGVALDFGSATLDEASILIHMLGRLPCSGSTKG